ncbi:hypothetical protein INR49_010573 [Caranx melampygus]|nr:hypothetical protein INR49_010573 [Caranx melampygus]
MRLVGTQARGCPPLFTAHRSVSALIIIKPSLPQIKARGLGLALPLSHQAEEELPGLCGSLLWLQPQLSHSSCLTRFIRIHVVEEEEEEQEEQEEEEAPGSAAENADNADLKVCINSESRQTATRQDVELQPSCR